MIADTPTVSVARHFLRMLTDGKPPSKEELARALDKLAVAYHEGPAGDPAEEDVDAPSDNYQDRYRRLRERFPNLGYYSVADPMEVPNEKPIVGDPIDDLADIAADLEQVLWRFEHVGPDDAHWHFKMLFEIHWGRHLRELALYLHASIQAGDEATAHSNSTIT